MSRKRTVVLISGRGSNMTALIAAASDPSYPAEIVGVISDRANAAGLGIAQSRGIATKVIQRADHPSKDAYDAAIDAALAGYMRILGRGLVEKWQGRMVNIHPALLPAFKGLDTHARAIRAGVRIHGCSVHFVTPEMDDGPIIAQAAVPVMVGDNEDTLAARVLKAEHRLYPLALGLVAEGKASMEKGHTVLAHFADDADNASSVVMAPDPLREETDLEQLARITP